MPRRTSLPADLDALLRDCAARCRDPDGGINIRSSAPSALAAGSEATSAWCENDRVSRRREVSNLPQTLAAFMHVW
jgi:hypothetical protein